MNYTEQMQKIWGLYEEAGMPTPVSAKGVAAWAIQNKHWYPQPGDMIAQCAEDLARALREDYSVDKYGRRYRTKHAVRTVSNGIQLTLWADIDKAPRDHMQKAFSQRRHQIVGDCHQLKIDVDHYNGSRAMEDAIQLCLDFTDDIMEIEALEKKTA